MRLSISRFLCAGVVSIGMGAAAVLLGGQAAASPFVTGGADCLEKMSGTAAPCAAVSLEASGLAAPVAGPPPGTDEATWHKATQACASLAPGPDAG